MLALPAHAPQLRLCNARRHAARRAQSCVVPATRRGARRTLPPSAAGASGGLLSTLGACWEVTQRVVLSATALGVVVAAAAATQASGRARLRALAAEFRATPEGLQAFQLLQYLVLALVVSVFESLTGVRGSLTFVYLAIAATSLMNLLRRIPGPEEARARVEALERGEVYVPPQRRAAPTPPPEGPGEAAAVAR